MQVINTTRLRQEWVDEQIEKYVTLSRFAEKLGVPPSTASRWIQPGKEVTGRVIGSVLNNFAVDFETAFVTTREEVATERIRFRGLYDKSVFLRRVTSSLDLAFPDTGCVYSTLISWSQRAG